MPTAAVAHRSAIPRAGATASLSLHPKVWVSVVVLLVLWGALQRKKFSISHHHSKFHSGEGEGGGDGGDAQNRVLHYGGGPVCKTAAALRARVWASLRCFPPLLHGAAPLEVRNIDSANTYSVRYMAGNPRGARRDSRNGRREAVQFAKVAAE